MNKTNTPHVLYAIAQQADARFSETVKSRSDGQRDRWTMTMADWNCPEVKAAYRAKVNADDGWLSFLRWDSEQRTQAHKAVR
jgi:hypothetical protein